MPDRAGDRPALDRLIDAHPKMFRGEPPTAESFLPQGWFDLVDKMCRDLEALLSPADLARLRVDQIKAKFAGLRFYHHFEGRPMPGDPPDVAHRVGDLVDAAEDRSFYVCQKCGKHGEVRPIGSRYVTLCSHHYAEQRAALRQRR